MDPRPGTTGAGRAAALAGLLLAAAPASLPAASGAAVQEADTVPEPARDTLAGAPSDTVPGRGRQAVPDSLLPDSLRSVPDSLLPDSLRRERGVDVAQRREALAGGAFPSRDSLFRRLMEERGYRAVEYRGRDVELEVPRRLIRLRDSAQANYGEEALRADSILYRGRTRFVEARGTIELVGGGQRQPVRSDSVLYYDVGRRKGTVYRARTQTDARGATWNVQGDAVPRGRKTLFVESGSFTSCQLAEPHYHFSAGQMKLVREDVIVAWPVVLRIGRVPVAWLPFFAQSMRPERASGILPPRFGFNDIVRTAPGMERQVSDFGYYWAINRFMDAQATVDWFSGNHTKLEGRFRYNFVKRFMQGNLRVGRSWGDGGTSTQFNWQHSQELSPNTSFRVNARFLTEEETFRRRSFDTQDPLRQLSSDVGFNHQLPWANLSLSASRRQPLSGAGSTNTTLPSLNLSFSPVTLFPAPRSSAGPFNNLTWNGSVSASRRTSSRESGAESVRRRASVSNSIRLNDFSLSASADLDNSVETPVDSAGSPLSSRFQTQLNWESSLDYQVDLIGSTTFKPRASFEGEAFASDSTGGRLLHTPTRMNFGASLNSDLFGFFPGFGPFTRLRHKLSPSASWRFSPPVELQEDRRDIPGFPATGGGRSRNVLNVSLNQTIEAKMRADRGGPPDTATAADTGAAGAGQRRGTAAGGREGQKVTLLSLRTSGLTFDFSPANEGPTLTTERVTNNISSDLLRGLSFNVTTDLFAGSGSDRTFDPLITDVGTSFSFSSGQGLGEILGLGLPGGGGGRTSGRRERERRQQQRREDEPRRAGERGGIFTEERPPERTGGGPWNVSVRYALSRSRGDEAGGFGGRENQTLSGTLNFEPTPNWEVDWRTSYNISSDEFGRQDLELSRDLHRWRAEFRFAKSPNGNVRFDVMVTLTDAPEIRVPYQIQTQQEAR